jgi:hypothetical protein
MTASIEQAPRKKRDLCTRINAVRSDEVLNPKFASSEKIIAFRMRPMALFNGAAGIAFPDSNAVEVDAALTAGNNLNRLYELACGQASIAKDQAGHYKLRAKGLTIIRHSTAHHDARGTRLSSE